MRKIIGSLLGVVLVGILVFLPSSNALALSNLSLVKDSIVDRMVLEPNGSTSSHVCFQLRTTEYCEPYGQGFASQNALKSLLADINKSPDDFIFQILSYGPFLRTPKGKSALSLKNFYVIKKDVGHFQTSIKPLGTGEPWTDRNSDIIAINVSYITKDKAQLFVWWETKETQGSRKEYGEAELNPKVYSSPMLAISHFANGDKFSISGEMHKRKNMVPDQSLITSIKIKKSPPAIYGSECSSTIDGNVPYFDYCDGSDYR